MDRKEIHVNDNPKQVGRVHGSFGGRRDGRLELADELKELLPDELLDELLAGARTEEKITGPGGLLSQLTKRLVERAMEVELTDHLGYDPHQEPPGGAGNTRNGSTSKTLLTEHGEDWAQAMETALWHVRRAGRPVLGGFTMMLAVALAAGPRPAGEALTALAAVMADQPYAGSFVLRGLLLAMLDRTDEAWAVALPAAERVREFGFANIGEFLAEIAVVNGDYEAAADYLRDACDALEAVGNFGELSTYAPTLGRALRKLGRYDEAEPLAQRGRELDDRADIMTQQVWRQTQALVYSARGQHADANRLAREAVDFSLRSDSPLHQGNGFCDLAEVLVPILLDACGAPLRD